MPARSAGLLMYRRTDSALEVFLVHPGGPFWAHKDYGAWTIPKGEIGPHEEPLSAAKREFLEETGVAPEGPFLELTPIRQRGGKVVQAWAFEGTCDPDGITSNTIELEWPPRSGRRRQYPEIDRAAFYSVKQALRKINSAQAALIDELVSRLATT